MIKIYIIFLFFFSCFSFSEISRVDPTKPFGHAPHSSSKEESEDINIQGIMKINDVFKVFINGKSYKENDTLNGFFIKKIKHNYIKIVNNKEIKKIWVNEGINRNEN